MYTPSAMCAPSRSALMTGLYPHRNGCHMNHGYVYDHVKSLSQYLKPLGYEVILVGKRHIKPHTIFNYTFVKFKDLDGFFLKYE
jgi:N-sulfoglucosamine sulfohydrolase